MASTAPGMSAVYPGILTQDIRLQKYFFVPAHNAVIMLSAAEAEATLLDGLVSMARGIGTTLGISLMALSLHLGGAGHGYAGSMQARPGFIVLAAASAAAAAIALASRPQPRGTGRTFRGGGPVGCTSLREM